MACFPLRLERTNLGCAVTVLKGSTAVTGCIHGLLCNADRTASHDTSCCSAGQIAASGKAEKDLERTWRLRKFRVDALGLQTDSAVKSRRFYCQKNITGTKITSLS